MSKPREGWWSYAKWMLRKYPERIRELEELRARGPGEHTGGKPQGGKPRPTENMALRELPASRQRELDAVRIAMDAQSLRTNGELRRELVRLVYWEQSHTLSGAAMRLHISYDTARQWNKEIIYSVGRAAGLMN